MTCSDMRLDLGAYVLGALEPADRARLEAHLEDCQRCRGEVADLAGLPGLLSHLTADEVEAGPPEPSAGSLDRMIAAFSERRARETRRRRLLAAAAAAVVLAGGGTAAGLQLAGGAGGQPVAAATKAWALDARTHVEATAWLRDTAWGTSVRLQLSGVPSEAHCKLVAVADDGHREQAGAWAASYSGTAEVTSSVSVPATDIVRLDIVTFGGERLVSVPVHHGVMGAPPKSS